MKLTDFDYDLPDELIAQTPLEPRDSSRLLVVNRKSAVIEQRIFADAVDYINRGDLLVFNDTRVIPARLIGKKRDTGAKIEVFLITPLADNCWEVLVKPGKKARIGAVVEFSEQFGCEFIANTDFGGRVARFECVGEFDDCLRECGEVPLPPYITEKLANSERYQTVYAKHNGSVAAPTAGLHFTPELLKKLHNNGVNIAYVTLHVGIGTFRPVTADVVTDHVMHSESYHVPKQTKELITQTKARGNRIIAVGTTAVRTLESAYCELSIRDELSSGQVDGAFKSTNIFIYPGYKFKVVDAMITNFHLPKSSLLMLVSAFAGREKIMAAYQTAINERYRFFSFGDAMLIY
ncbi:MAG: tRNA preQ1(34) S-adenosylmethionine ribosyltransferase-isomerase QueA [Negativicutes bacterium]|jgi:S-adenosylmethionine:tRNA ribosyltransferase-isomerase